MTARRLGAAEEAGIAGRVTDDTGGVLPGVTVEDASPPLAVPIRQRRLRAQYFAIFLWQIHM